MPKRLVQKTSLQRTGQIRQFVVSVQVLVQQPHTRNSTVCNVCCNANRHIEGKRGRTTSHKRHSFKRFSLFSLSIRSVQPFSQIVQPNRSVKLFSQWRELADWRTHAGEAKQSTRRFSTFSSRENAERTRCSHFLLIRVFRFFTIIMKNHSRSNDQSS